LLKRAFESGPFSRSARSARCGGDSNSRAVIPASEEIFSAAGKTMGQTCNDIPAECLLSIGT
jgi:hypothetical protein